MSNVFRFTPLTYFQVPDVLIEAGIYGSLIPSARDLYALLLYKAQRTSRTVVNVTATDAAKVGLSPRSVQAARACLIDHRLIAATRNSAGYLYELLNPASGETLERIEEITQVDPELIAEYFLERLAAYDAEESHLAHSFKSRCPFHSTLKERDKPLHIVCTDGGMFKCHGRGCDQSAGGGIVDFEIALAKKNGETLDKDRAYGRVRDALLSAGRKRSRREAEELAERRSFM